MDVGIRELKAHLSEYVDRASRGEHIRVTDRGVVKAVLAPLPPRARIEQGLAEGWITRSEPPTPRRRRSPAAVPPGPSTAEILADDRGD